MCLAGAHLTLDPGFDLPNEPPVKPKLAHMPTCHNLSTPTPPTHPMAARTFYIEAWSDALEAAKFLIERDQFPPLPSGEVGGERPRGFVIVIAGPTFGDFIRHGVHPCEGGVLEAPVVADGLPEIGDVPFVKEMAKVAMQWFATAETKSPGMKLTDKNRKMLTVFGAKEEGESDGRVGSVHQLEYLLWGRVPTSENLDVPCIFEISISDGRFLDIFQLPCVVEAWKALQARRGVHA